MKQRTGVAIVVRTIAIALPLLAAQPIRAQTGAVPQVYGVYGGTIGNMVAFELPGATNVTRIYAATESPNSVFYGDVDHSKTNPFSTANFSFAVVPDLDANASHGAPSFIAVHEQSGLLFVADEEDGLMSCDITSDTITTNISETGFQSVLIEGSSLFAMGGEVISVPELTNALYFGALDPSGALTPGSAPLSEPFVGTASMDVHPINNLLYILTACRDITPSLKKSSAAYNAFSGATTFSDVSLPAAITNFSHEGMRLGIGPDGRLFIAGGMSTGSLAVVYSDNDGIDWTEVDTGGMAAGGSSGINVETVGTSNAYEVYFGTAASSNKGVTGTWQSIPRGGHGVSPSTHANAGCVIADPLNTDVIYLTTDKGIGASTNRAVDIFELNEGLTAFQINDIDLTDSKDIAWLASKSGVRIATDFNTTPVWYDADFPDAIVFSAAMDKTDTNGLTGYAASVRVYKTVTGGGTNDSSWECVLDESIHGMSDGQIEAIEVDGSSVFVGCYGYATETCEGGAFMSADAGTTWTNIVSQVDVMDIIFNTENGERAVYVAASAADEEDLGGIYRYVESTGADPDLDNGADICDLAVDSSGSVYASGSVANTDPSTRQIVVYKKTSGSSTWTSLTTNGLPSDLSGSEITGRGLGPVITVGTDSSNNEIPVLAVVRTLYCLPYGGSSWVSVYTYPEGTQIKCLYWDELLVGTEMGLYGQDITVEPGSSAVAACDFDGDGKTDLAIFDNDGGYWYVISAADSVIAWAQQWGWSGAVPVPGDYDNDGISDMAVFDGNTGYWYIRTVSGTVLGWSVPWGWPGAVPVCGDYNADGTSDLAVFDSNTGYWYVYSLSGSVIAWEVGWGWPGAVPVSGDYDGDGVSDIAVFDSNTGYWYVYSLSGGVIAWEVGWGWPGAVPVSGDYDGDGVSDIAVFDSNTGYWYVYSLSGSVIVWEVGWGWPGAVPVSGDYDGDGVSDIAVFDSNTGYWYVYSLSGSVIIWQKNWGWPGATPVGSLQE